MSMKQIRLGILGGGQLGRMSALAAAELGISAVIFTPDTDTPASQVSFKTWVAPYDDYDALRQFAENVDFISYEFENIPVETVRYLQSLKPVYPDERLLEVSQDRIQEKSYLNTVDIATTRWAKITKQGDIERVLQDWGTDQCILKTTRFGYDGKGQLHYKTHDNLNESFRMFKGVNLIAEELVDFTEEISVIIARDANGGIATYGPMLNHHKNHILNRTFYPSGLNPKVLEQAVAIAERLAVAVNLRGILTLEFFLTKDGRLLANEIAPRTHNSGHWTLDACGVSQFEQHVRTVCGLPVGSADAHSAAEMVNLIGNDVLKAPEYLGQDNACVHLYGKQEIKSGRKMGHVTFLKKIPTF